MPLRCHTPHRTGWAGEACRARDSDGYIHQCFAQPMADYCEPLEAYAGLGRRNGLDGGCAEKGAFNMGEQCGEWVENGETMTYDPCPPDLEDGN